MTELEAQQFIFFYSKKSRKSFFIIGIVLHLSKEGDFNSWEIRYDLLIKLTMLVCLVQLFILNRHLNTPIAACVLVM